MSSRPDRKLLIFLNWLLFRVILSLQICSQFPFKEIHYFEHVSSRKKRASDEFRVSIVISLEASQSELPK